jgi:hypothetical protein
MAQTMLLLKVKLNRRTRQCLEEMGQGREDKGREDKGREDKGRESAGELAGGQARAQAQGVAWDTEEVLPQALEAIVYARNVVKRPFIRQERPVITSCAPSAALP